jgi:class 3 adenylate cyclase
MKADTPATILVVDDMPSNRKVLESALELAGYRVLAAGSGSEALDRIAQDRPDIVLLDILMPDMSGIETCAALRRDPANEAVPVILVTALDARDKLAEGMAAGADDFIQKPVQREELLARVKSLLRVKRLFDALQARESELYALNETLEERVREQTAVIDRLGRLRRYVSTSIADMIVREGAADRLAPHRARIAAVCCDLRDFTAFALRAEPEDTMAFLRGFYDALGSLVMEHEGTIDHFTGDGILVFFNDPVPCDDPAFRAVRLALAVRDRIANLIEDWNARGHNLGIGIGVTFGFATMGEVGFEFRREYAGTGTPVNLASRLSDLASDGQILVADTVVAEVEGRVSLQSLPDLVIKGFPEPVPVHNAVGLAES